MLTKERASAAPAEVGVGGRSEWLGRLGSVGSPLVALAVLLGVWELISRTDVVNPIILPPPSEVAEAFGRLVQRDFFWAAIQVTAGETLAGFGIGSGIGLVLGALIGAFKLVRQAIYPFVIVFQNTPRIALAPLFLTWFGFGQASKIMMAAAICFFPLLINVVVGIETVEEDARTVMRSIGASRWQTFRLLTLPHSLPVVFAGLKTAMTFALLGAIVAEFVGATEGMGVLIDTFNFQLKIPEVFAVILTLSAIGLLLYGLMELLDRKIVFWHNR